MRNLLIIILALLFSAVIAPAAIAGAQVQVSSVNDIGLGSWSISDPAVSSSMQMCIGSISNSPAGGYAVIVTSSTGSYTLTNGTHQIAYSLYWDDSGSGSLGSHSTQLTYGTKLASQVNANALSATCLLGLTGANAQITIKISTAALTAALAGTYTGTITILISPN